MKDPEIVSSQTVGKIRDFLFPRVAAILCLTGLLAWFATLMGVLLAWRLPDFRESWGGDSIREDVMWVLFLSQLIILVPFSIYVCCKRWVQIEFDNVSKTINRIVAMIVVAIVGGFIAIHARILQETFKWEYDGEFMGCAIMYLCGTISLLPIARKYRIDQPGVTYEKRMNQGVYRRGTWLYCGIFVFVVLLALASITGFYFWAVRQYH